ncbi:MAG: ParB/RepB/Spo0J family partition protein [Halobacteriovoraceae bacterium]|nr:ParB/RepB/Spo0J family partition protein [Halobacteriovoraceae bacterium]
MAKAFSKRVSKKARKKIVLGENLDMSIFKINDEKLLRGAELQKVKLSDITVREQVRTKFNDESIKELADNIKENGLIQPLVLHREDNKFVLICGERRYRAMTTIKMKEAPCFILENKTREELMAIQFSENSSREALHYIDQADSIFAYKKTTGASERKIQSSLGVSKSEVHRCLMIAKLPVKVKEAAKRYNIEKYVLLEWSKLKNKTQKSQLRELIVSGELVKRAQLKMYIDGKMAPASTKKGKINRVQKTSKSKKVETEQLAFLKPTELKSHVDNLDLQTRLELKEILEQSLS